MRAKITTFRSGRIYTALLVLLIAPLSGCINIGPGKMPDAFVKTEHAKAEELVKAATAEYNSNKAKLALFDAGVAESNRLLEEFFVGLDLRQANLKHHQNLFNITTGAAVGVLGYTGASTKTLGLIGLGQTGVNSEMQNYAAVFLLTPALGVLQERITDLRIELAKQFRAEITTGTTVGTVKDMLVQYHSSGSLGALRYYLEKATDIAPFEVSRGITQDSVALTLAFAQLSVLAGREITNDLAFLAFISITDPTFIATLQTTQVIDADVAKMKTMVSAFWKTDGATTLAELQKFVDNIKTRPEFLKVSEVGKFTERLGRLKQTVAGKPADTPTTQALPTIKLRPL